MATSVPLDCRDSTPTLQCAGKPPPPATSRTGPEATHRPHGIPEICHARSWWSILRCVAGPCCGGALHAISETLSEMLDFVPARLRVRRIRRPKYGYRTCGAIHEASAPDRPIAKGLASPGLLAHVLVSKYCGHTPLYRQTQIFARHGSKSTARPCELRTVSAAPSAAGNSCWRSERIAEAPSDGGAVRRRRCS